MADPVLLEDDMIEATPFEEMADGQAGLPATDHDDGIMRCWGGDGIRHDGLYSSKASTRTAAPASQGLAARRGFDLPQLPESQRTGEADSAPSRGR